MPAPLAFRPFKTVRTRVRETSIAAEARRSDGSPLVLQPHDCRHGFASEHLNNNTPVRITQALLGHASPDVMMNYAELYRGQLIEEYRKTVRSLYNAYYGEDGLKNPTAEEWAFAMSCNLRDMGTHLCGLPTGEHCPKGLICLGCAHAQPKKSAVPIFRRCCPVTSAAWWLREVIANLPDRSRPARWRLSGSRERCRERRS
jgi:Phage integrase family